MNKFTLSDLSNHNIKVNIEFSYFEKNNCYNITFTYNFPSELDTLNKKIIFMKQFDLYDKITESFYEGDIINKNPMTEQLINLIMLNDDNLKTHSGHVTSECYRLSLIHIIKLLWD
jgi:hypothetical protein